VDSDSNILESKIFVTAPMSRALLVNKRSELISGQSNISDGIHLLRN